jgi:hypothetical protein
MKKILIEGNQICENILLLGRNRNYLRFRSNFLTIRFHKAKNYGSYGSGSTTLARVSPHLV